MSTTGKSAALAVIALVLLPAGALLWTLHARSWDLGGRSPVLAYDAAEYAVAARELADRGRMATPFALPIELAIHAAPPWPLALVQPGLLFGEAALFRVVAPAAPGGGAEPRTLARRERLVLVIPILSYLATALVLAWTVFALLSRDAPAGGFAWHTGAAIVIGACFLLDPEAQHYAAGGFTELPFTLGLALAIAAIALGAAARRPLLFGLLLGVAGAFRGNMLWLSPVLVAAAAATAPRATRLRTFVRAIVGYALPLAPWWIYKWRMFGTPAWDLSALAVWDGIDGRSWFSLNHLPEPPRLPTGGAALAAIARKTARNLTGVLLVLLTGPRAMWAGALVLWPMVRPLPRTITVAAATIAVMIVLTLITTAASVPQARYLFPARVLLEAAGALAVLGLVGTTNALGPAGRRGLQLALATLAIGWGVWQTARGASQARLASEQRGTPNTATMRELSRRVAARLRPGEPVMSSLGPLLAWYAERPVVHLALSPADLDACRRNLDVRGVLLVFRDASRAWPEWVEVMERPNEATHHREWNVARVEQFSSDDGFRVVWLELGPLGPKFAASSVTASARDGAGRRAPRR